MPNKTTTRANDDDIKSIYELGRQAASIVATEHHHVTPLSGKRIKAKKISTIFLAGLIDKLFEIEGHNKSAVAQSTQANRDTVDKHVLLATTIK